MDQWMRVPALKPEDHCGFCPRTYSVEGTIQLQEVVL